MRRRLGRQDTDIAFQGHLPGCMWSVLHILDHHYWHSNKRISFRRKQREGKHTICLGYPRPVSFERYTDEVHEYLDSDAVPLMAEHGTTNAGPTDRISGKDHIKALVAKEMSARSQMQRDDSISCLSPSNGFGGMTSPIIIVEKSADTNASLPKSHGTFSSETGNNLVNESSYQKYSDAKKLAREISHRQIMECVDVLEIFKMNKKLFVDILQDPDVKAAKNIDVQLTSDMKVKLKKSGSFPLANSPENKYLRPSTLEHKWRETWSFRKGEKLNSEIELPRYISSKSLEDFYNETIHAGVPAVTEESNLPSPQFSQGSHKHGWQQSFMGHLKDMMKKIKHTLKESKKPNTRTLRDALSTDEEVGIQQQGQEIPKSCHETSSSKKDRRKDRLSHMRRVSSLNESLDRYARLFECSLTREAKWRDYKSKSLKLINEENVPLTGYRIRSFKRRISAPDLDSFYSSPNETSNEALPSEMQTENAVIYDTSTENENNNDFSVRTPFDREQFDPLGAVEESQLQKNMEDGDNSCENNEHSADFTFPLREEITNTAELHKNVVEPEMQRHGTCQDQEIGSAVSSSTEHEKQSHALVLETLIEDHLTGPRTFPVSEGSELDNRHISIDEVKPAVDQDNENDEKAETMIENHMLYSEIKELDDADFNYVRDVLEVSGLIQQGCLGTWYSLDQPLSPILFKELEVYLHHEVACSSEDVDYNCDHQLLFDLINAVLLQIYESSLNYFPRPFSFTQRARPLPDRNHILEEVWKRISWHRSTKLRTTNSLDDIAARDLSKEDGWVNLQLDVEDIALDLEDFIFDELLDEVIF